MLNRGQGGLRNAHPLFQHQHGFFRVPETRSHPGAHEFCPYCTAEDAEEIAKTHPHLVVDAA
jgi:hypothetical protein